MKHLAMSPNFDDQAFSINLVLLLQQLFIIYNALSYEVLISALWASF